jgi:hypothetical protein
MTNKIKLNKHRIKEALAYRGQTFTWLATRLIKQDGTLGADKMTLSNYLRDGFTRESAQSVADALGVKLRWLRTFLMGEDLL